MIQPTTASTPPAASSRFGALRHRDKSSGASAAGLSCALIYFYLPPKSTKDSKTVAFITGPAFWFFNLCLLRFFAAIQSFLQRRTLRLRHVVERRQPAALQRADVSNDRPAVGDRDVRTVGDHQVFAVSDRIENCTVGLFHQSRVVEVCHR